MLEQAVLPELTDPPRKKRNKRWLDLGLPLLSLVCFVSLWELTVKLKLFALPSPQDTLKTFLRLLIYGDTLYAKNLFQLTGASLWIVVKGCSAAFVLAIPLGVLVGANPYLEKLTHPILEIFRPVPPLAWIPLAYLMFSSLPGPTRYVQAFIVFVGAFFPAVVNTLHGIKNIDPTYIQAAKSCGASPGQILRRVLLPGSLPAILTGIRIGIGIGWMCCVAAEFVGGRMGIGFYIWDSYSTGGRAPEIVSGIIAIGIVGYLLNAGIVWLERRLLPWR